MGLDMFLRGKKYVYSTDETLRAKLNELGDLVDFKITELDFEAGYWRKANAIHRWFVDTVQDGRDDCGMYRVAHSQLRELRSLCKTLLEKKDSEMAQDEMPPQAGFFFGSTDIDDDYWQDLADTVAIIEALESREDFEYLDFDYQSSW